MPEKASEVSATPAEVASLGARVAENVAAAVTVPEGVLEHLLVALIGGGHVLIEDYPGVGKTALARALAASTGCESSRIQCTADMLPSDITGANVFNQLSGRFEFRPGPVFANLVLVDEINRAPAKTQSGLLECMQERRVTIERTTHELAQPFLVLATQNPADYEGTYPLPEAQQDRFMLRISLGYPEHAAEAAMLGAHASGDRVLDLTAVASVEEVLAAQLTASSAHASDAVCRYVVALVAETRSDPRAEVGASPRAGLMLLRAAMARATLSGRDHALPDDVQELAHAVLAHRLLMAPGAGEGAPRAVIADALAKVPAL
jgi:MoxR-like ATPase